MRRHEIRRLRERLQEHQLGDFASEIRRKHIAGKRSGWAIMPASGNNPKGTKMRSLNNLRRQIEALRQADVEAMDLPATPEAKRQSVIEGLSGPDGLCARAFGPDDKRSNPDYLNGLSRDELMETYRLAMKTNVAKNLASGESDWFKALPYEAKIQILRGGFNAAAAARLKKQWEATQCGR